MKFEYLVRHNGVLYPAGTDVPVEEIGKLMELTITSEEGQDTGYTKLTIAPVLEDGHSYKIVVDKECSLPDVGSNVKMLTKWDGAADIEADNGKQILVIECDSTYKAVKAGITTVTAKA
jgi:hypothetical protein